jgi:hypothetical protein
MGLTILRNKESYHEVRASAGSFNMMRSRNSSRDVGVLWATFAILASIALWPAWAFTDWELNHPITGRALVEWCGSPEDSFKHGMCIGFFWGLTIPCVDSQLSPPADAKIYLTWAARHTEQLTLPAPVVARIALCEKN